MTQRLVAYRSLSQIEADATFMAFANAASVLAARWFVDLSNPLLTLAAVATAILSATLLSEILAGWRARRRGAELISRDEYYRRTLAERASRPIWTSALYVGSSMAFTAMIMLLALVNTDHWHLVAIGVGCAAAVGALFGLYAGTYARSFARAAATGSGTPSPTPFVQVAMRHYAGYASGLALALLAAAQFDDKRVALAATLVAFFVGKAATDFLMPAVYYETSPKSPRTIRQFMMGIFFAVAWWGIPLGALAALITHVIDPEAGAFLALFALAATSVGAIMFQVFMTILIHVTRGSHTSAA